MNIRIALVLVTVIAWGIPVHAEDQFLVECQMYRSLETDSEKAEAAASLAQAGHKADIVLGLVDGRFDGDDPDANGFYKDGDDLVWRDSDSGEEQRYELVTSPSLMVLADQEASIKVGRKVPSHDAESGNDEALLKDVGTSLSVLVHNSEESGAILTSKTEIVLRQPDDVRTGQPVFSTSAWESNIAVLYGGWSYQHMTAANGEKHLSFLRVTRNPTREGD